MRTLSSASRLANVLATLALLVPACSVSAARDSSVPDGGTDGDVEGSLDGGSALLGVVCRFTPDAQIHGPTGIVNACGSECAAFTVPPGFGGVSFGGCAFGLISGEGVCTSSGGGCIIGSSAAEFPDGGSTFLRNGGNPDVTYVRVCCGDGPGCSCGELCWSPDGIEAPHCIPMPPHDAGP